MKLRVEVGNKAHKLALPDQISPDQDLLIKVDDQEQTVVWLRQAGIVVRRATNGVETHLRLRHAAVNRFEGEAETRISLEYGAGTRMVDAQVNVRPDLPAHAQQTAGDGPRPQRLRSQISGKVLKVMVKNGDRVEAGQALLIIEAMKMENQVFSPVGGIINQIGVKEGDSVQTGKDLLRIAP